MRRYRANRIDRTHVMMETMNPTAMIDCRNTLGECILWCDRTLSLLWTDIEGATLYRYASESRTLQTFAMPERLASFALTDDDDRLLLGLESQLAYFSFSSGLITPICDVEPDLPSTRINDGRCDRQGRFVFGTFNQAGGHAPLASFYRLNHDLTLERLPLERIAIANSICFSLDGCTMYYCDSPAKEIRCCDYDLATGSVSGERRFADLAGEPGVADGSLIDADGYLWNAQWGGARVVRYAPDGSVDRIVTMPISQPSSVAFGGPRLDQLYVTTARAGLSPETLAEEVGAGSIFHAHAAGIAGLPADRFTGTALIH